jgi:hypothetical protein
MLSKLKLSPIAALVFLAFAQPAEARQHRSSTVARHFEKSHPCPSTGLDHGACPGYVKDHIKALCDGGPDTVRNLQWQNGWEAAIKDRTECHSRYAVRQGFTR